MEMQDYGNQQRQQGFTLIELLISIVVVGILTAVAIVGIGGLVDNGHTAACQSTADAAKAASAAFFANSSPGFFPSDLFQLTSPQVVLDIPSSVTVGPVGGPYHAPAPVAGDKVMKGNGWTLTMSGGAGIASSFACA